MFCCSTVLTFSKHTFIFWIFETQKCKMFRFPLQWVVSVCRELPIQMHYISEFTCLSFINKMHVYVHVLHGIVLYVYMIRGRDRTCTDDDIIHTCTARVNPLSPVDFIKRALFYQQYSHVHGARTPIDM